MRCVRIKHDEGRKRSKKTKKGIKKKIAKRRDRIVSHDRRSRSPPPEACLTALTTQASKEG